MLSALGVLFFRSFWSMANGHRMQLEHCLLSSGWKFQTFHFTKFANVYAFDFALTEELLHSHLYHPITFNLNRCTVMVCKNNLQQSDNCHQNCRFINLYVVFTRSLLVYALKHFRGYCT